MSWLAIVGALGGGLGGIAGIAGVVVALWARSLARKANEIAEQGNELAQGANEHAVDSNRIAREANRIAVEANELVHEANAVAERGELRETERHDVRWEGDWEAPGRYVLINVGEDEAHQVSATVTVDEEEARVSADVVEARGRLVFDLPGAAQQLHNDRAKIRRERRRARESQFFIPEPMMLGYDHVIAEHVIWTTDLGKERVHEKRFTLSALGDLG